jgi:organic radical activating enzyme
MGNVSDRYFKTSEPWAWPYVPKILASGTRDINPSYLEISFSNVCNFKCAYCTPDISSKWAEEIKQFGTYPTSHKTGSSKPTYNHNEYNPYVEAFWKWWPELSKNLKNLRLTGGEPLLSKDVWSLLEKLENDPNLNPNLSLGINTNLNVPKELIEKLIGFINRIAPRIKSVEIFTSNEAINEQAEYIRYGLNYKEWYSNLDDLLSRIPKNSFVGIMTTINILSLSTIDLFIEDMMALRTKHYTSYERNMLVLSINYLRYPPFLHIGLAPQEVKNSAISKIENIIEKYKDGVFHLEGHYATLYHSDIERLRMICNLLRTHTFSEDILKTNLDDFSIFVTEYDRRRGTDFDKTFPELIELKKKV